MDTASETDYFSGFDYPANALLKFNACGDLFTFLLKDGTIIHYTASDTYLFKKWLVCNGITDIRLEKNK
ncbi:hypothetical protein [Pedobacter mendelii]|uniref:KTSC domain-containing protein n=1 Tax=Pedobacter mendelii TaxID=1908240 RepID=A0ABQ2BIE4_9SPHI|nr:hypothetical protein [Pedobacter mendelii]GGI25141.1 hypothetical protein GCM10008119_16170 [Pedobacter mendelii]